MAELFEEFLAGFREKDGEYLLIGNPKNEYRHFGRIQDGKQYFSLNELQFIFSSTCPVGADIKATAYFELKNSGYNIINHNVYIRTKHFNRKKDIPICQLKYSSAEKTLPFIDQHTLYCITGKDLYCFIEIKPINELNKDCDDLYKH